jgi:AraC-like DNA-binding protein
MPKMQLHHIKTISGYHELRGLPKPEHPLISIVDYAKIKRTPEMSQINWVLDFYHISIKRGVNAKLIYGQQQYDFDEGIMFFISPNQVFRIELGENLTQKRSGWMLLVHPDFLWNTPLAKTIKRYEYFDYSVNEALFLSDKEETILNTIIQTIQSEYHSNIDIFSQGIIISQIEKLLTNYFNSDDLVRKGLPTVRYLAKVLNVSTKYLSSLLKTLTGQTAQQHIHEKLIAKAKEKLSTTDLSVGEIAYELGFEHSQSFSKLFKSKTNLSPLEFRQSFQSN